MPRLPRLPRETKVDVTKCHACHAKWRGAPGDQRRPTATKCATRGSQVQQDQQVPRLPRKTQVDVFKSCVKENAWQRWCVKDGVRECVTKLCVCLCVCVWNICTDVKLLHLVGGSLPDYVPLGRSSFRISVKTAGGQRGLAKLCPTKLFASIPGSMDWSSVCTCQVMITCCSGSASVQLSMFADGKRLNPRTSKTILFISSRLPQSVFRRSRRTYPIYFFAEGSYRRCICVYLETHRRNIYLEFQNADQTLWILVYSPVDNFGYSSSFSRKTSCDPFVSKDLDWFAFSGFSSCRII